MPWLISYAEHSRCAGISDDLPPHAGVGCRRRASSGGQPAPAGAEHPHAREAGARGRQTGASAASDQRAPLEPHEGGRSDRPERPQARSRGTGAATPPRADGARRAEREGHAKPRRGRERGARNGRRAHPEREKRKRQRPRSGARGSPTDEAGAAKRGAERRASEQRQAKRPRSGARGSPRPAPRRPRARAAEAQRSRLRPRAYRERPPAT